LANDPVTVFAPPKPKRRCTRGYERIGRRNPARNLRYQWCAMQLRQATLLWSFVLVLVLPRWGRSAPTTAPATTQSSSATPELQIALEKMLVRSNADGKLQLDLTFSVRSTGDPVVIQPWHLFAYQINEDESNVRELPVVVSLEALSWFKTITVGPDPTGVSLQLCSFHRGRDIRMRDKFDGEVHFLMRYEYKGRTSNWIKCAGLLEGG
jgi:hypothetical protein